MLRPAWIALVISILLGVGRVFLDRAAAP